MDRSAGWDEVAEAFIAARSDAGSDVVRAWAEQLPANSNVLDIGCGSGIPISKALVDVGLNVFAIDASPKMVAAFRAAFPSQQVVCEPAEESRFFHRRFNGAVAVGLVFLLPPETQRALLSRIAAALVPGGRLLFSAPEAICQWQDRLTGQASVSIGRQEYQRIMTVSGMRLQSCCTDAGGNHYFSAIRHPG